jgi:hypothetical protein
LIYCSNYEKPVDIDLKGQIVVRIVSVVFFMLATSIASANDDSDDLILKVLEKYKTFCKENFNGTINPTGRWVSDYSLQKGIVLYIVDSNLITCHPRNSNDEQSPVMENMLTVILERKDKSYLLSETEAPSYEVRDGKRPKLIINKFDGPTTTFDLLEY